MKVRPGQSVRDPDPSQAYAARLHDTLSKAGVEHKVVTYQYRYVTRLREEAVGTRTAVLYRDPAKSAYQWWIKDDRLNAPVWLPNGEVSKQVSFYLRRKAEVIEEKNYASKGGASSKASLAFAKPSPKLRVAAAAPERAVTKIVPVKKAPAPVVEKKPEPTPLAKVPPAPVKIAAKPVAKPEPTTFFKMAPTRVVERPVAKSQPTAKVAAKKKPIAKLKPRSAAKPRLVATVAPAKPAPVAAAPKPATKPAPVTKQTEVIAPIASRSSTGFWNPPGVLDRAQQPAETAPRDRHLEEAFRAKHGSEYNAFSPSDRRKMSELQDSQASGGE